MNTHSSLPPPSPTFFVEGGNEISKKLGRGSKLRMRNQKGEGRGNGKIIGSCDFSHFHFLTNS